MTFAFVPPFLIFLLAAALAALLPTRFLGWVVTLCALVAGLLGFAAPDGVYVSLGFFKYSLELAVGGNVERLSQVALCLAVMLIGIAASKQSSCRYHAWGLALSGLASGVLSSGDLVSIFLFFELIVITTTVLIAAGRTHESQAAALRFIIIQLLASIIFKVGMSDFHHRFDSYSLSAVNQPIFESPLGWTLVIGLFVKVSAWPLAFLTPMAISKSNRTGQLYLSALLPLASIGSIWKVFNGHTDNMVFLMSGVLMILYGMVYGIQRQESPAQKTAYWLVSLSGLVLSLGVASNGFAQPYALGLLPIISVLILLSAQQVQLPNSISHGTGQTESHTPAKLKDTDALINRLMSSVLSPFVSYLLHLWATALHTLHKLVEFSVGRLGKLTGPESMFGGNWGIGPTCLWVIALLSLYGIIYLLF